MTQQDFDDALKLYLEGQQHIINENWKQYADSPHMAAFRPRLEVMDGKRYVRIVKADISSRSAMAFIDKTSGDVLKAASWKAPAKHARGNIFDDYNGLKTASAYGPAYLR